MLSITVPTEAEPQATAVRTTGLESSRSGSRQADSGVLGGQANLRTQGAASPRNANKTASASKTNSSPTLRPFSRIPVHPKSLPALQLKPLISTPGDRYEQEADRVAQEVTGKPAQGAAGAPPPNITRLSGPSHRFGKPQPSASRQGALHSGRALAPSLRGDMERRFGHDFSSVRIHTGDQADRSTRALGARAYTQGRDIVFGSGRYAPGTTAGQRLIAHELVHVVQQQARPQLVQRDEYTPAEREAMAEGRAGGTQADRDIAQDCGFQPGDIVFRLGSAQLAERIGEPVTHGGIYLGGGLIHDMVGFGNRSVPITLFYNEAADPSAVRIVRFTGPLRDLIVRRVVANVRARDFDLPTDPVPFNLFSSADNYDTATCLEYSHAQFLYAIKQLNEDTSITLDTLAILRSTYFAGASDTPDPLIQPKNLQGSWPVLSLERWLLVAAADYLAEDVDPDRFENRWEGNADESIDSFTYSSFVDATQFFTEASCAGGGPGTTVARYRSQVGRITERRQTNVTDPIDRTVVRQTGLVWAQHSNGRSYLTLVSITNSSQRRPPLTVITFQDFVDEDLRELAIRRATPLQPRGFQTIPWSVINQIPTSAEATTAWQ